MHKTLGFLVFFGGRGLVLCTDIDAHACLYTFTYLRTEIYCRPLLRLPGRIELPRSPFNPGYDEDPSNAVNFFKFAAIPGCGAADGLAIPSSVTMTSAAPSRVAGLWTLRVTLGVDSTSTGWKLWEMNDFLREFMRWLFWGGDENLVFKCISPKITA